jgi:hypothetical protein
VRSADLRSTIQRNAAQIVRLHERVHETFKLRDRDAESRAAWGRACQEFHSRYGALCFPGGYGGAGDRILAGDADTLEATLCFLEVRPYFFRSGYMYSALMRKMKRATLPPSQAERLLVVRQRDAEWRAGKRSDRASGA